MPNIEQAFAEYGSRVFKQPQEGVSDGEEDEDHNANLPLRVRKIKNWEKIDMSEDDNGRPLLPPKEIWKEYKADTIQRLVRMYVCSQYSK